MGPVLPSTPGVEPPGSVLGPLAPSQPRCYEPINFKEFHVLALDIDTVRRIARLARIRVPDDELPVLADELSRIMDWIEQLNAVDTSNIAPMTSVADIRLPQREDRVNDGNA